MEVVQSSAPELAPLHGNLEYDHSAHYPIAVPKEKQNEKAESQPWVTPDFAPQSPQKPRICGLTPKFFWLVILAIVVILAAGIGGGVGAGLSQTKSISSPNSTPSPTATNSVSSSNAIPSSSATSSASSPNFSSGCNATDQTLYTPSNVAAGNRPYTVNGTQLTYKIYCNKNFADKSSGSNPSVAKLQEGLGLASLQDCISACASYNAALVSVSTPSFPKLCSGVVYLMSKGQVLCDLNNNMIEGNLTNVGHDGEINSAILEWSQ